VYPQIFPTHKRPSDAHQNGTLSWAKERVQSWMKVLDAHMLGKSAYLAGSTITIADYYGSSCVSLGEAIRVDYSPYPNVTRWLGKMKELESWNKVYEVFYGFAGSMKATPFEAL
jgi:glutathione S-transferase